jgi:crotonobetaine/carnitine-CoA ligase
VSRAAADLAVPRDLPLAKRTIPALLEHQAGSHGGRPLVRAGDAVRTVAQMRDAAAAWAGTLADAGVEPGDRVVLMLSNRFEMLDLMLGCAWRGAIAAPVNTALRGAQLDHVLRNADPSLMVLEADFAKEVVALPAEAQAKCVWVLDGEAQGAGEWSPPPAPGDPVPAADVGPGTIATIFYTSGTTGPSKGVLGPHAQIHGFARRVVDFLEIDADDVLHNCLPLFHVNAWCCFFQALLSGATYGIGRRFSASRFWQEVVGYDASVTYLLGAMIPILLKQPVSPYESRHRIRIVNGNPPPPDVMAAARERFGISVAENYASTETSAIFGAPLSALRAGWVGKPMDGFEAMVVDEDDIELPPGTAGELLIRPLEPYLIASGYFRMPERTVEAWRNLWFHTGDRVVCDESGWHRFIDRIKDSIRRRGENISAFEVEQVISAHPDVSEVAVIAVPSELGEDEVMAVVVPRPGAQLDPEQLTRVSELQLAYFALPRYVEILDSLPVTENGKVKKYELRDRGVTEATWDREASGYVVSGKPSR